MHERHEPSAGDLALALGEVRGGGRGGKENGQDVPATRDRRESGSVRRVGHGPASAGCARRATGGFCLVASRGGEALGTLGTFET
jgi:hypothetical protein